MTKKKKTVISLILFVLLFGGLLVTATFTDLQVSKILTAHALSAHTYYTNDPFGASFEAIGSSPVYLMLALSTHILFWKVMRDVNKKGLKEILAMLALIGGTVAYYVMFDDAVKYGLQHVGAEEFKKSGFIVIICIFFALLCVFMGTMAVRSLKAETVNKLVMFAIAVICVAALSNLIVTLVKIPMGRMRFRAMNTAGGASIGGFDNFTRWYVANGQMEKEEMRRLFGTTDACKSFPSGHTCSAGMVYTLIMLIDVLDIKSKGKKAAIWIAAIGYTATVAISRIVVGAHFFSDVLMGGTIAFVCTMLFREIFICKGANVKALFGKE